MLRILHGCNEELYFPVIQLNGKIIFIVKVEKLIPRHGMPMNFFPIAAPFEGQTIDDDLIATKILAAGQTVYSVILYIISPVLEPWQQPCGPWIILDGSTGARLFGQSLILGFISALRAHSLFCPRISNNSLFFHPSRYEYINNSIVYRMYMNNEIRSRRLYLVRGYISLRDKVAAGANFSISSSS